LVRFLQVLKPTALIFKMKWRKGWGNAGPATLTALAATVLILVITARPSPPHRASHGANGRESYPGDGTVASEFLPHSFLVGTDKPIYPEKWRTTLEDALKHVVFDPYVPAKGSPLSVDELRDIFLFPEGSALVLGYPPIQSTNTIRQNFIEVYEAAWSEKDDALSYFRAELEANPADGQSLASLSDGRPALTVLPRSKDDLQQANPAYLEFELNRTYIQISGGNSLDDLLSIANELIQHVHAA
jgi:hypothetical protein